ncbi:MAG: 5-hydroxyisourate hydrolase [Ktedonobacterales bacterium]|jgi:5-hydroxyisourate hydrolase|nr:MAG: 5-hydroxyisourate hydrolase [Ktedonobacterales bacterium]
MAGKLTTHVLDTAHGIPAAAMGIELWQLGASEAERTLLTTTRTNDDGRIEMSLLDSENMAVGVYELVFDVGGYFTAIGLQASSPPFLGRVPVRFGIADPEAHYHVPLLVSPWAYSTYRGS